MKNEKKVIKKSLDNIDKLKLLKKQSADLVNRDLKFLLEYRKFLYENKEKLNEEQIYSFTTIISNLDELLRGDFSFNMTDSNIINKTEFDFDEALKTQSDLKEIRDECYSRLESAIEKLVNG